MPCIQQTAACTGQGDGDDVAETQARQGAAVALGLADTLEVPMQQRRVRAGAKGGSHAHTQLGRSDRPQGGRHQKQEHAAGLQEPGEDQRRLAPKPIRQHARGVLGHEHADRNERNE